MRLKLTLLLLLASAIGAYAQRTGVAGKVVDALTGAPVSGAGVMLNNQGVEAVTGPSGDFLITRGVVPGTDALVVFAYGYADAMVDVVINEGQVTTIQEAIRMRPEDLASQLYNEQQSEFILDQNALDDEEGAQQAIATLSGASEDVFYKGSSYNWRPMNYRYRGYDYQYSQTLVNGLPLNDLARGGFSYSQFGGMNRAVRNKKEALGMGVSSYSLGDIGGTTEVNAFASDYAAGFYGAAAYTNSNYMFRALAQYATGLNKHGWAFMVSAVGRYSKEGVIEGTWYESFGLFGAIEKQFNRNHSLNLTFYGAPTQRAGQSAVVQEAYDLAGSHYYNPNWGYQNGEKRSARVARTFDPTVLLNWLWKNNRGTRVNTGVGARWVNYQQTGLEWGNTADPRPDYYRYMPSYYKPDPLGPDATPQEEETYEYQMATYNSYANQWRNDESMRQLDWDSFYNANRRQNELGEKALYMLAANHSDQFNLVFSSTLNTRLNDVLSMQGGLTANYTDAHYFRTVDDLLGGEYWLDVDKFADRDFPGNEAYLQNNLNDPNRKVTKGDVFGYDYNIRAFEARAWLQNVINLRRWDINYGLSFGYTQFYRKGNMRNGRAPENSYGRGKTHRFETGGIKVGATYKIDGHNFLTAHAVYETKAPLFGYAYLAPRIKDTAVTFNGPERVFSADLSYGWNYRNFRGQITAFWTDFSNLNERSSFYDDRFGSYMDYVLAGVHKRNQGVEVGAAYKMGAGVTLSAAVMYSRYRYCNNPMGTRSYENGSAPDTTQRVYLKNFYLGARPQTAFNIGLDWAAPHSWFFNVNVSWMGCSYVSLSPIHHEALPELVSTLRADTETLYTMPSPVEGDPATNVIFRDLPIERQEQIVGDKVRELSGQERLRNGASLNLSVGKIIRINRKVSLNLNLSADNVTNNQNLVYNAYQQGRFDYTNYDNSKFPNRYSYAQGIKFYFNVGVRF